MRSVLYTSIIVPIPIPVSGIHPHRRIVQSTKSRCRCLHAPSHPLRTPLTPPRPPPLPPLPFRSLIATRSLLHARRLSDGYFCHSDGSCCEQGSTRTHDVRTAPSLAMPPQSAVSADRHVWSAPSSRREPHAGFHVLTCLRFSNRTACVVFLRVHLSHQLGSISNLSGRKGGEWTPRSAQRAPPKRTRPG